VVRTVAEVFSAGDVIGGRYRLERLLEGRRAPVGTGLWRAEDMTLARPVAVRLVVDANAATRAAFLAAASRAGALRDTRLAATYDADVLGSGRLRPAYLVREWIVGQPLAQLVHDGGLDPTRLGPLLASTAEALAALHAEGGWHGRLHPDNVLVVEESRVRLTDAQTGQSLAAAGVPDIDADGLPASPPPLPPQVTLDLGLGPRPDGPGADPEQHDVLVRRLQRYDTCDLARVCYAAATGSWPGGPWRDLPAARSDDGRPLPARKVRAAVPRDLDGVITRTLLPTQGQRASLVTAAAVAAELERLQPPEDEHPVGTVGPRPRRLRRSRRLLPVLALIALVILGLIGYSVGKSIGKVPGTASPVPTFSPTGTGSAAAAPVGAPLTLVAVTAFDPPPGDGMENDDQIPLAHDGSTATAWTTSTYDAPHLGNLKPGVGLLVDLGEVDLVLQGTPTGVELRAADTASPVLAGYPLVTSNPKAGTTVRLIAGQTHRYWLVWLTSLPKVSGGYRGAIAEMTFRS
jgi:hypothetical protein